MPWPKITASDLALKAAWLWKSAFWKLSHSTSAYTLAILMATAQPTHSQDLTENTTLIQPTAMWEMDIEVKRGAISTLLKAAAAWFDMDNFRYEITINPDIRDDIYVLSDPEVLYTTRAISQDFFRETWINLEMIDIIAIAKVVQTKVSFASDALLFEEELIDFLSHYPAYQDVFGNIFWKYLWETV